MSKSVVLDIDRSIKNARTFWKSLSEASSTMWPASVEVENRKFGGLETSLLYYNHNEFKNSKEWPKICSALSQLSSEVSGHCFNSNAIKILIELGIELPSKTILQHPFIDHDLVIKSLDLIKKAWPPAYHEIQEYMKGAIVIANEDIQGQTAPTWFGAVFLGQSMINTQSIRAIATSVVHEVGHLVLFAQSSIESPLTDISTEYYSAFRQRKRPAILVLHAQIALARMIIWLFNLKIFMSTDEGMRDWSDFVSVPQLQKTLNRHSKTFLQGMLHIRKLSTTQCGNEIIEDFTSLESILLKINS